MKLRFLLLSLSSLFFLKGISQDTRVFAITGQANKNFNWTDIRQLDVQSGQVQSALYENGKTKFSFISAETHKPVENLAFNIPALNRQQTGTLSSSNNIAIPKPSPTQLMSAAVAYDKRHGKLFFSVMKTGQLIWMDLHESNSTAAFYTVEQPLIKNDNYNDESLNITRMTIGADGNGYAITNDGNHLIRFTTGNKVIITDLGNLVDAESNSGISIHNQCSSWGGDVVADAFGKLYLLTASRNVFEIDTKSRIATYRGIILNLSPTYTLNGAAVADDNTVLISSANTFEGFYKINMRDLSSVKIVPQGQVFNASDLASCNLLNENEKQNSVGAPSLISSEVIGNRFISIYPNPVSNGHFKITFDNNPAGRYEVALSDLQGRLISTKIVNVKSPGQSEDFQLHRKQASGMYMLKITDAVNKAVFSDKLIIE